MSELSIYAEYVVDVQDIERVVPKEIQLFKDKAEEVLLIIKLASECSYNVTINDLYDYCARDDIGGNMIYNALDDETWDLVEDKLSETYNALTYVFRAFKDITGVGLNIEMNYQTDKPYFYLIKDDVVELTPQAIKLRDAGVVLELQTWVEEW